MATYQYKAYTKAGDVEEGEIEASDEIAVSALLFEKGLLPFETYKTTDQSELPWWKRDILGSGGMSNSALSNFTREMATLLSAGIPLDETLRVVERNTANNRMKAVTARLLKAVLSGTSLSDALRATTPPFPSYFVNVVQAGEASGSHGNVFSELAAHLEQSQQTRSQIQSALFYPAVLLIMAFFTLIILMTTLVPTIAQLFENRPEDMPTVISYSLSFQLFLSKFWLSLIILGAALFSLGVYVFQQDGFRNWLDAVILSLPIVGRFVKGSETASITRTLATLLKNGLPLTTALATLHPICRNRVFAKSILRAEQMIKEGKSLNNAVTTANIFPEPTSSLIAIGEKTGKLDMMLLHLATIFDLEVKKQIAFMVAALTPVITLTIGLFVGILIISVMSAILSANDLAMQ